MKHVCSFRLTQKLKESSPTRLIVTLLMVILSFAAFAAVPAAHAASVSTTQTSHCAVVLPPQHEHTARLLCAPGNQPVVVPAACITLATVFVDTHYQGASTPLIGCAGPCDAAGYHFDTMPSGFNNNISSYKVFNNCFWIRLYGMANETGACIETFGDVGTLFGTGFNDRTTSMRLASVDHSSATCPFVATNP